MFRSLTFNKNPTPVNSIKTNTYQPFRVSFKYSLFCLMSVLRHLITRGSSDYSFNFNYRQWSSIIWLIKIPKKST